MKLIDFLEFLMNRNAAYIDIFRLKKNISLIKKISGNLSVIFMVKANAYGHGLKEIAKYLDSFSICGVGVASIDEAKIVRKSGYLGQVYLFDGGAWQGQGKQLLKHNIVPLIFSEQQLDELISLKVPITAHLKIDTGFFRYGISYKDLLDEKYKNFFDKLLTSKIIIQGIGTHFCDADNIEQSFTTIQEQRFAQCLKFLTQYDLPIKYIHAANSARIMTGDYKKFQYKDAKNIVRSGLCAYGIEVSNLSNKGFLPVLSLKARICQIKDIGPGETIGYGRTFTASKPMKIAILSIGYGDGLFRAISKDGHVLIGGHKAKIIGAISMDSMAVDVTKILTNISPLIGSDAILLGSWEKEEITANDLAKWSGTISYEVLCKIADRVPRVITKIND